MPKKKLEHYQICRVDEVSERDRTVMALRCISLDDLRDPRDAPDGTYIRYLSTLYLPKRKRGVKFRATYTQIFQKDL